MKKFSFKHCICWDKQGRLLQQKFYFWCISSVDKKPKSILFWQKAYRQNQAWKDLYALERMHTCRILQIYFRRKKVFVLEWKKCPSTKNIVFWHLPWGLLCHQKERFWPKKQLSYYVQNLQEQNADSLHGEKPN